MILGTRKMENHFYFQGNAPEVHLSVMTHNNKKTERKEQTKTGVRV